MFLPLLWFLSIKLYVTSLLSFLHADYEGFCYPWKLRFIEGRGYCAFSNRKFIKGYYCLLWFAFVSLCDQLSDFLFCDCHQFIYFLISFFKSLWLLFLSFFSSFFFLIFLIFIWFFRLSTFLRLCVSASLQQYPSLISCLSI